MNTQNDLTAAVRGRVAATLNQQLADLTVLASHVQSCHWNVRGPLFYMLHTLFGDLYGAITKDIDRLAERVAQLNAKVKGTVHEAVEATTLKAMGPTLDGEVCLHTLVGCYAQVAKQVRRAVDDTIEDDQVSGNILIDIQETLDKGRWFLEAHLQNPES